MQDLHSIAGSTGRIYIGDRRMHPCPNQALKCPRCDSLNTKFCYFNNYNLSQPRHFCKSCRRYWTKGGVLRNVPVGGGCRKSKRSKPKHSSDTQMGKTSKSSSNSSSESSTLTAGKVAAVTAEASALSTSGFFPNPNPNSRYETPMLENFDQTTDSVAGVFPDTGNFVDTIAPSATSMIGFNVSDPSPLRSHYNSQKLTISEEFKLPDFLDQTVPMDLPPLQRKTNDGEFTVFDWNVNGEQGLFELTGNNDHGFWNQNQWAENDNLLPFRNFSFPNF